VNFVSKVLLIQDAVYFALGWDSLVGRKIELLQQQYDELLTYSIKLEEKYASLKYDGFDLEAE
jgi:hypothetical protein